MEKFNFSLLSNVEAGDVFTDPFPHLVVKDPIESSLCEELISKFPSLKTLIKDSPIGSNQRFSYPTRQVLLDDEISDLWKEFVRVHTSQLFLNEFLSLFQQKITELYPSFEKEFGSFNHLRAGIRGVDNYQSSDVLLDAQISINTPVVSEPSAVRRGHIDNPNKLFFGLYYLRHPDDNSEGGNLEIYQFKDGKYVFNQASVDDQHLELVKTIPYERNLLVMGVNSINSLHGVTARSITDHPRIFLNLVGEINGHLFDLPGHQQSMTQLDRFMHNSKRLLKKSLKPFKAVVKL